MLKKQNFNRLDMLAFTFFLLTCYAGINFIVQIVIFLYKLPQNNVTPILTHLVGYFIGLLLFCVIRNATNSCKYPDKIILAKSSLYEILTNILIIVGMLMLIVFGLLLIIINTIVFMN